MYIVDLIYLKPLAEVQMHLEAHRAFVDAQYAREIFLASGPKHSKDGGVFVINGRIARDELDKVLAADPFHLHKVALYKVTEFSPVKFAPALAAIL